MRACMVAYSIYESDNRVRKYAESLTKSGWTVDVIAIGLSGKPKFEIIEGVNLYRIQRRDYNEKGKFSYFCKLLKFLFVSFWFLTKRQLKCRYNLVHIHSIPDFEVFAALVPKIAGAKIILDIHDPVPDFFASKFGTNRKTFIIRMLSYVERISSHFAHHVITVTDYWGKVIKTRSSLPEYKLSVIVNFPDTSIFDVRKYSAKKRTNDQFQLIYPGTINKHCGLDIAIKAVKLVKEEIKNIQFNIYGRGSELQNIKKLVSEYMLNDTILFHQCVPLHEVPALMVGADAGIALLAGKNSNYAQQALNVKLFEFLAMGLPVIATRTESTSHYLDDSVVMFSEMDDIKDIARCIKLLCTDEEKRKNLIKNGLMYIQKNNWLSQQTIYNNIIASLIPVERDAPLEIPVNTEN